MVRCRSARTRECLVRLQIVAPALQGGGCMGELDTSALCREIACRMRLLGGLAVDAPSDDGLSVVDVRRNTAAGAAAVAKSAYDVGVRLKQASPLVVAVLRAACTSMVEGPVVRGKKKLKSSVETTPIAIRVLGLVVVTATAVS